MIFNNSIVLFFIVFLLINVLNVTEGWLEFLITSVYPAFGVWQKLLLTNTCCYATDWSSAHDNYSMRVVFFSCDCV